MKNIITAIIYLFATILVYSQEQDEKKISINDFNFKSITNPAFILLDETPTAIETPDNLKSLSIYLSKGYSEGNIALEVNPYWAFNWFGADDDNSYEAYRGMKHNIDGTSYVAPTKALTRNLTFSLGYVDKQFEGFEEKKKTIALGARTTFLEVYGKKRVEKLNNLIKKIEGGPKKEVFAKFSDYFVRADLQREDVNICDSLDSKKKAYEDVAEKFLVANQEYASKYDKTSLVKAYFESVCPYMKAFFNNPTEIKPVFRLDGAIGYSILLKENNIETSTANRFGAWLTADFAFDISKKENVKSDDKNTNNYLHILAIGKRVSDGFNIDENQNYFNTNFWDYGAKVELELYKLKFSYEYLEREGKGNQYRSVGNITYQINKKMSITGGFGKDFPEDNNLITILGINWGLDLGEKSFTN